MAKELNHFGQKTENEVFYCGAWCPRCKKRRTWASPSGELRRYACLVCGYFDYDKEPFQMNTCAKCGVEVSEGVLSGKAAHFCDSLPPAKGKGMTEEEKFKLQLVVQVASALVPIPYKYMCELSAGLSNTQEAVDAMRNMRDFSIESAVEYAQLLVSHAINKLD